MYEIEIPKPETFAPGVAPQSHVKTREGAVPIDWLRAGDEIMTYDAGWQPVSWIGRECLLPDAGLQNVTIPGFEAQQTTVLGAGQRVLVSGWELELMFGQPEMLTEAIHVTPDALPITTQANTIILLNSPALVQIDDLWIEAAVPTPELHDILTPDARRELRALGIAIRDTETPRPCLRAWEVSALKSPMRELVEYRQGHAPIEDSDMAPMETTTIGSLTA